MHLHHSRDHATAEVARRREPPTREDDLALLLALAAVAIAVLVAVLR